MNDVFNFQTQSDLVIDTFLVIGSQNGRHAFSSLDGHGVFSTTISLVWAVSAIICASDSI